MINEWLLDGAAKRFDAWNKSWSESKINQKWSQVTDTTQIYFVRIIPRKAHKLSD